MAARVDVMKLSLEVQMYRTNYVVGAVLQKSRSYCPGPGLFIFTKQSLHTGMLNLTTDASLHRNFPVISIAL